MIEQIIKDQIENNKENFSDKVLETEKTLPDSVRNYNVGYREGYHDALVDLLNTLKIDHEYEIHNQ